MVSRPFNDMPGDLDGTSMADLLAPLRRLVAQLGPLLDEADLVLDGDPAAASRWRSMLAWRPEGVVDEPPGLGELSAASPSLNTEGVGRLWAATALAAGTNEQLEAMSYRLVELLAPAAALAQLEEADPPVLETMMAVGIPGLPGLFGGGLPGGGLPHGPGIDPGEGPPLGVTVWPGARRKPVGGDGDPIDIDSAREMWDRLFRPGLLDPRVPCGVGEILETLRIQKAAGDFSITSLQQADACPGTMVTITGTGFLPERDTTIVFSSAVAPEPPYTVTTMPASMTSTSITVVVPVGATSGPVRVRTQLATINLCGYDRPVFQRGNDVGFVGGVPVITSLKVDGRDVDCFVDGSSALVEWTLALPAPASPQLAGGLSGSRGRPVPGSPVTITVTDPTTGTVTSQTHPWPQVRSTRVLIPPAPPWVDIAAEYKTACGLARKQLRVWVGAYGRLEIVALEVTQGIQQLLKVGESWDTASRDGWNTLELIADKPTVVRAYPVVRYPAGATNQRAFVVSAQLEMHDTVTGQRVGPTLNALQLGPDQQLHYGVSLTVGAALPDRRRTNQSFNFHVPKGYAAGELDLRVLVTVGQGVSPGQVITRTHRARWRAKSSLNVHYVRVFTLGGRPPGPLSDQEARQAVYDGLELLPFPVLRLAPSPSAILSIDEVWTASDGNDRLLDEIEEIGDDYDDTRYMAVVNTPVPSPGISGTTNRCETSAWATREPIVIAHEFSHMFCFFDLNQPQPPIANVPFDIARMTTLNDLAGTDDLTDYMGARAAAAFRNSFPIRPIAVTEARWTSLASNNAPW